MEQKQRLFIYDRREVLILVLLGLMVAAFAFTLGVHLGKTVVPGQPIQETPEVAPAATLQDNLPNKQEFTEQGKNAQSAADEELSHSLQDEVQRTGIKLNIPRQVDLPAQTKSVNAGATSLKGLAKESAPTSHARSLEKAIVSSPEQRAVAPQADEKPLKDSAIEKAEENETPAVAQHTAVEKVPDEVSDGEFHGKFALQIGSYPSAEEAKTKMDDLRTHGLHPFVRSAQVKGLGRRFRLFLGEFSTREDAEKAGRKYQSERMIDTYLVNRPE